MKHVSLFFATFILFPTIVLGVDLGDLNKKEEHAQALSLLCMQTKFDPEELHSVMKNFDKKKVLPKKFLKAAGTGAEFGYAVKLVNQVYFVTYGSRQQTFGGPFCSIMVENVSFLEAKTVIKEYFSSFKFVKDDKMGLSSVSLFVGPAPGYQKDLVMAVQTEAGLSNFSFFFADPKLLVGR